MRLKIKTTSLISSHQNTVLKLIQSRSTTIQTIKQKLSDLFNLSTSSFHFECNLKTEKIILSDDKSLSFFFTESKATLYLVVDHFDSTELKISNLLEDAISSVMKDNPSELQKILEESECEELINKVNSNGWGLIHHSSVYGKDKVLKFLINSGANLNLQTVDDWTPLSLAAANCQASCLLILLKSAGIQINKMTRRGSALHIAVENNNLDIVSLLLNCGVATDLENVKGLIPLQLAQDDSIIELIPKYQGMRDLERYTNKNKPQNFSGKLKKHRPFRVTDSTIFMNINLDSGQLEEFTKKDDCFNHSCPVSSILLAQIEFVGPRTRGLRTISNHFYFEVTFANNSHLFYTKNIQNRDEWVDQLCQAINYCQVYKQVNVYTPSFYQEEEIDFGFEENSENLLQNYQVSKEIGSGSYGTVFKVVEKSSGQVFAMKSLSKAYLKRKEMLKYAVSEIKIMRKLVYPFVLNLKTAFENSTNLYMILEFCDGGDLEVLLEKSRIPIGVAKLIICEIVLGLEFIHSKDVIYRDLKPSNILIDSSGHIRLADFGLATNYEQSMYIVSTLVGSPAYIAPEIVASEKFNKMADVYSLGVVVHEILTGKLPFDHQNIESIFYAAKEGKFSYSKELSKPALDLIKKLMYRKPAKRPGFGEIKNHPFFQGIDWKLVEDKKVMPDAIRVSMVRDTYLG
jgi:serum/glucocorticoid-regulated kinase 2